MGNSDSCSFQDKLDCEGHPLNVNLQLDSDQTEEKGLSFQDLLTFLHSLVLVVGQLKIQIQY
jgi:hypothetical protein